MIKLSKNGIKTLNKQYRSVLLKCLAINAGVFMMTVPAMATEITEDTVFSADYEGAIYNSSDMGGQGSLYFSDELVISDGKNTANEHIIVGPIHDFENGNNIKITGGETTFIGRSLDSSSGTIEISGGVLNFNHSDDIENDDLMLWAAKDIIISGGTINLNGEDASIDTIYDWTDADGNPYPAPENPGNINISGGTINMNVASQIASEGAINISGGTINLKNDSDIHSINEINIIGGTLNLMNGSHILLEENNGDINISGNAKISSNGIKAQNYEDNQVSSIENKGTGDINISGNAEISLTGTYDTPNEENDMWADMFARNGNINVKENAVLNLTNSDVDASKDVNISGGTINLLSQASIFGKNVNITGGSININQPNLDVEDLWASRIYSSENIAISGGEININNGGLYAPNINISGGKIDMNNGIIVPATGAYDNPSLFKMTGGEINMTESYLGSSMSENNSETEGTIGRSELLGGTINIKSGKNIFLMDNPNVKNTINIAAGAELSVYNHYSDADKIDDIIFSGKSSLQLNEGAMINLAGNLSANIDGDDRGLIVFENSNAVIDGNVESPSITFNASHSLSKAITGSIGGLDKLTIAKGTLTFDKEPVDTITTVKVANGATLDIGLNTLHSTGDKEDGEGVYFNDNSTLKFTVTSADTHGQIKANYVNISENGTTLNMTFNGAAIEKDSSITIQLFDQSEDEEGVEIEGKFANLASNTRYKFTDEGNGYYKVSNVASASDVVEEAGGNANNTATAEAWDNLDTSATSNASTVAVANKLAELSNNATTDDGKKAYIDALTALAPETAPMTQQVSTETANQIFGAVGTRLSGGSVAANSQGMSSGDANGYEGAVWAQTMYNKSKLDDTKKSKGFDADTAGTVIGLEKYFNEDVKAGIGYAYSKSDIDGFMRDTDVKTHTAIAYGEYKPNNWFVNGIVTYGWSDYNEKKNVAGIGVNADYDVETLALQAMTGYDIYSCQTGVTVTPEAGLRYVHIKNKAYTDTADEHIKNSDSDILTGVLGARLNKTYAINYNTLLKPEFTAAMTYDLANDDTKSVVTLVNGSSYAVSGKALNRFGVELGAGLTAEVNNNVELFLGYEGKFREDYQDHTGLINAKYKF